MTDKAKELARELAAITCSGCAKGYPLKNGWHDTWDDSSIHMLCTNQTKKLMPIVDRYGHLCAADMADRLANHFAREADRATPTDRAIGYERVAETATVWAAAERRAAEGGKA